VSPYQDHEAISEVGHAMASKYGLIFEYQDFRSGFREGQEKAKDLNLYRQKFCGCAFSFLEGNKVKNEIRLY
jgi:epoxyqueuosine reductase